MSVPKAVRLLAVILASYPVAAAAQQPAQRDYPAKPVRVVVPYAAGGPMDFIARTLGRKMIPALGQNMVIDNRPGAGGALGTDVVAKTPPDGYTILHTSSSHASLPVITKNLPYDAVRDFVPISLVVNSVGFLLVAHPSVPARSVRELIASAKAQPGKYNYGSGGIGNVMHFSAEIFNVKAGTKMTHVPYKGVGQAITDLVSGRIDICFGPGTVLVPYVKAGRLKALAITAPNRWNALPDVPTVDESGVKGYTYVPFYGLWFPAGTPAQYVNRIQGEVAKALEDAEIRRAFEDQGFVPVGSSPAEFSKIIQDEIAANRKLAASIGLKPE